MGIIFLTSTLPKINPTGNIFCHKNSKIPQNTSYIIKPLSEAMVQILALAEIWKSGLYCKLLKVSAYLSHLIINIFFFAQPKDIHRKHTSTKKANKKEKKTPQWISARNWQSFLNISLTIWLEIWDTHNKYYVSLNFTSYCQSLLVPPRHI